VRHSTSRVDELLAHAAAHADALRVRREALAREDHVLSAVDQEGVVADLVRARIRVRVKVRVKVRVRMRWR
jgi:hypothetical protein